MICHGLRLASEIWQAVDVSPLGAWLAMSSRAMFKQDVHVWGFDWRKAAYKVGGDVCRRAYFRYVIERNREA